MIFWHLGGAVAIVRSVFRDPDMDLRTVMLGALLPDLIDKPLGTLLLADVFDSNSRIFAHTLIAPLAALTVVMMATRRGTRRRKALLGVPIGMMLHLLLDGMWTTPETFWWPLFGWSFPAGIPDYWSGLLGRLADSPLLWAQEGVGLLYLAVLWRRAELSNPDNRRSFARTGRLVTAS